MLNKKEQELMESGAVAQELAQIEEQKRKSNEKMMARKWKGASIIYLILFLGLAGVGVGILLMGLGSNFYANIEGFPVYMVSAGTLIVLGVLGFFFSLRRLLGRKKVFGKSIMVAPDGEVPEYPQETVAVSSVEQLKQEEEEKPLAVKKIYAEDPEKRVIKMEKKRVERVLDHNISFPKLHKAIISACSKQKVGIDEKEAALLLGKLAYSRVLFIHGVDPALRQGLAKGLAVALEGDCGYLEDASTPLAQAIAESVGAPKPKHSFILGVDNLDPKDAPAFFHGVEAYLSDYSIDHPFAEGLTFSMNLILLVFIPEGPVAGIPKELLEKCPVFGVNLTALDVAPSADLLTVRCTGDELRYLALRQKTKLYVSDETEELFDAMYDFADGHGFRICNDVENAIEREEAVLLELGLREDTILGSVVSADLLPFFLAAMPENAFQGEGGLKETVEKTFTADESSTYVRKALRILHPTTARKKKGEEQQ